MYLKKISLLFLAIHCSFGYSQQPVFFGQKIREVIIKLIDNEQRCIKVAMYTFTDPLIATALLKAKRRGVRIECVVDGFTNRIAAGQGYNLRSHGIMAMQYLKKQRTDLMHSKYFIFDKTKLYKNEPCLPCVLMGSYNCTHNAAFNNIENVAILSEKDAVDKYHKNFCKIKKESIIIPLALARKRTRD